MATADLIGTWFPSGYYGHFRSKTRNDILQEYRHEATPLPPNQFIKWVRTSPDTHRFSKHDNRHSFPTDASYFDSGMGRRRGHESITAFKPELIAWMPHKEAIAREGASVSLYRLDFRQGGVKSNETLPQRISPRIRRKMADMEANDARLKWVSDYKKQFCHGQPNPRISTDISTGRNYDGKDITRSHQNVNKTGKLAKVVPSYLAHTRRRTRSAPPIRYSVGDCLVWNPTPTQTSQHIRNSVSMEENATHAELTPRPPTERPHPPAEKRASEVAYTPRAHTFRPQQTTKVETKNMTPAATAISSFTPIQPDSCSHSLESAFSPRPEQANVNPTVVIN